jgi:hypothetical protein
MIDDQLVTGVPAVGPIIDLHRGHADLDADRIKPGGLHSPSDTFSSSDASTFRLGRIVKTNDRFSGKYKVFDQVR